MSAELIGTFSPEEIEESKEMAEKIHCTLVDIHAATKSLSDNWARLGTHLARVRSKKYWMLLGDFRSFGDYLKFIEEEYNVGHSQLYLGISIARNLVPILGEEVLCDIGITKAGVLSKYVEQSGSSYIPPDLLEIATNPKKETSELKGECALKLHQVLPEEVGRWWDMGGGFFVLDDEKKEILEALEIAKNIDPVVAKDQPEWAQNKEAWLRLAREFKGTYA